MCNCLKLFASYQNKQNLRVIECRLPVDSYLPQFKKSSNGASNSPRKGLHILNLHVNSYLPHLKSQMGQIDVFLKNP